MVGNLEGLNILIISSGTKTLNKIGDACLISRNAPTMCFFLRTALPFRRNNIVDSNYREMGNLVVLVEFFYRMFDSYSFVRNLEGLKN
jgi:hypothetical protein